MNECKKFVAQCIVAYIQHNGYPPSKGQIEDYKALYREHLTGI